MAFAGFFSAGGKDRLVVIVVRALSRIADKCSASEKTSASGTHQPALATVNMSLRQCVHVIPAGGRTLLRASVNALRGYPDIPSVPAPLLGGMVESIVGEEGPVHVEVVVGRIRDAWGLGRAGGRIRAAVEDAVALVVRSKRIRRSGEFLLVAGAPIVPRDRSNSGDVRKAEMVAPEEVEEAVVQIVRRNLGVKPSEVASAVTRLLGFSAVTQAWRDMTAAQVLEAQHRGRIALQDEMLVLEQSRS